MSNSNTVQINVYCVGGDWFGARWVGGEYDGCDELDVFAGADEHEAVAEAHGVGLRIARMQGTPHQVVVKRVSDETVARESLG